jgi:intergrase/recombinase
MPRTAYSRILYAKRYAHCLFDKDFNEFLTLNVEKRNHVMKALSCLSKFLGMHDEFLTLVKKYGLKWSVRSDDLLIKRFTKAVNLDVVFQWVREVKNANPDFADFMDFIVYSGLRFSEAIESYNLIVKLNREGKLSEYYDAEREILEHFKFKNIFLRRSKKAFITFMPRKVVERIAEHGKPLNLYGVQTRVRRHHGLRFGDIREVHGTLLVKYLREVEIDFLHGRISTTVFMRNYFNPAWISDLKDRVFKAIDEIRIKSTTFMS